MQTFLKRIGVKDLDRSARFSLILICLVVFSRSFGSEFVFDSAIILEQDPRLQSISSANLWAIVANDYWWPTMGSDLYRPIVTFSFFIERTLFGFGARPAWYQFTNLVLHVGLTLVGYSVLRRIGLTSLAAFGASLWFAIHPYAAEVVPNVVGRADALALLTILLAFDRCIAWQRAPDDSLRPLVWSSVFLTLGCFAKESALAGVAICVWHSFTLGRDSVSEKIRLVRTLPRRIRRSLLLCFLLVVPPLLAVLIPKIVFAERAGDALSIAGDNPLVALNFLESRVTALFVLGDGLLNALVPLRVSADYSYSQIPLLVLPFDTSADWQILATACLVALVLLSTALLGLLRRSTNAQIFWLGAAICTLLPTSNLFLQIGTVRADRLIYPAVWFMAAGAASFLSLLLKSQAVLRFRLLIHLTLAFTFIVVAAFTHFRGIDWRTNMQFWESTHYASPESYKAKLGYGAQLVRTGDLEKARLGLSLIDDAMAQVETSPWSQTSGVPPLGLQIAGNAWVDFARLARSRHHDADVSPALLRGEAYLHRALTNIEAQLASKQTQTLNQKNGSKPNLDGLLFGLTESLRARGQGSVALQIFERHADSEAKNPRFSALHAWTLAEQGRLEEAKPLLIEALVLNPYDITLSKEVAYLFSTGTIPDSQRPLADADAKASLASLPPLKLDPELKHQMAATVERLAAHMQAEGRGLEAVRLRRSYRAILNL
jgi:hypothetical protein